MQTLVYQSKWQFYRTIERLGWLGNAALALLLAAALAYLLLLRPMAARLSDASQPVHLKPAQTQPASNATQLQQYLASLPPVANRASAIKALMDISATQNLLLDEVSYKIDTKPNDAINHYHVEFSLFASYPEIQHFLSELLHQMRFVSVESLTFSRESVQDSVVEARIHLVFHFRQS
jgi:hypothetical protein